MAGNDEELLRRSLDAVDRHRNRLFVGLGITLAFILLVFIRGTTPVRPDTIGATQTILAQYFVLIVCMMTALALVITIQITVMTKRILRAIELAANK